MSQTRVKIGYELRDKIEKKTRRERLKSAPYLRLKKRKTLFLEKN